MKHFLQLKSCKAFLFFLISVFYFTNPAFSQAWQWAKTLGGPSTDGATFSCADPTSSNIFIAGYFGSASINVGTITINNAGVTGTDVFISKWDANGNVLWAQRIGGSGSEFLNGITADNSGRVYITGAFTSSIVSVPPYSIVNTVTTSSTQDVWLACFDGFGSPAWLKKYGNANSESGEGIIYSPGQNCIYLTGGFGSPTMLVGSTNLTNANSSGSSYDMFLVRMSTTGSETWAIRTGGTNSSDYGRKMGIDASNNHVFIGGSFSPPSAATPTTQIGSTILTTQGNTDVFVCKYSDAGVFQWARSGGSSSSSDSFTGLTVDGSNNCYITGSYFGAPMILNTVTLTNNGGFDAFLAKYSSIGNLQFATSIFVSGNTLNDDSWAIDCDASNNIYMCGSYAGTVVSYGSGNLTNTTPGSSSDIWVGKFNTSGAPIWITSAIGSNYETARHLSCDALGNLYVAGTYNVSGPMTFGSTTISAAGGNDGFVSKIGCLTSAIGGPSNVCTGSSATLTATGATSYTWSTGATTSSIVVAPSTNTVYTVTGSSGSCIGTPGSLSVTVLPASLSPGSNLSLLCKQKAVINASCSPAATLVTWSLATNLSNSSVLNPTVTAGPGTTNYTVTTTLNNGCVKTGTVSVSSYAQTPDICQVTVDSLSVNNEIYWDKTLYPQADSFIVYRETSTNVYTRIGGVPRTALSMYVDTNRSIGPANGDPNLTYYRYKLRIKDSCSNVSALSLWHETIFIQDQMNGNFNWNQYAIESTTSTPVSIYNLKRRMVSTGTETLVTSTTGGLASDPAYNSFWPLNVKWFVDAIGFNCNTTAKFDPNASILVVKNKTKSNQSNDKLATNIGAYVFNNNINVYPNPVKDILNVDLNNIAKAETSIEILNALGQVVYHTSSLNQHLVINTSEISGGVYIVTIKQNDKTIAIKKVVIDR